jgi:hypothetical protein
MAARRPTRGLVAVGCARTGVAMKSLAISVTSGREAAGPDAGASSAAKTARRVAALLIR